MLSNVSENDIKDLVKCKAEMTKDPLKDLTLKVIMFQDDKFAVIHGQRSHADPNVMSKWAKMRQLLSDHKKIQKN